jgi:hypothetical protein
MFRLAGITPVMTGAGAMAMVAVITTVLTVSVQGTDAGTIAGTERRLPAQ